jgi:surface antigen
MKSQQKLYSKTKGLRFRKNSDASDPKSIIRELAEGEEMTFVDGPWLKVRVGDQEGWVHGDYVTDSFSPVAGVFRLGIPNLPHDATTVFVRKEINDEYGGGKNSWELQCTEYVTYRVKKKLGVVISWPVKSGRNGGKWGSIFQKHKTYAVFAEPKINCAMSFTSGISSNSATNKIGHVAFIEEVYPDGSIKISEANWPRNGIYNERVISVSDWKNKYKALFISFS